MLPDKVFSLTMTYDGSSCDLVAVLTTSDEGNGQAKEWSTTAVPQHQDNDWHDVRDLLIDFLCERF